MKKLIFLFMTIIVILSSIVISVVAVPPFGIVYSTGDLNASDSVTGNLMPWYNLTLHIAPNGTLSGEAIQYHFPNYYDRYTLSSDNGNYSFDFTSYDGTNSVSLYSGDVTIFSEEIEFNSLIRSRDSIILDGIFYVNTTTAIYFAMPGDVILEGYFHYLNGNGQWQMQYISKQYSFAGFGTEILYLESLFYEIIPIQQTAFIFDGQILLGDSVSYGYTGTGDDSNGSMFPSVTILYNSNRFITYNGTPVYSYSDDEVNIAHYISTHNTLGNYIGNSVNPTGTITISSNGEYDVSSYSTAVVDVPQQILDDVNAFNWLYGAVNGFLQMEILPGFSLGGILLFIAGFALLIWILKIFLGG